MTEHTGQPLTREALAQLYQWDNFPESIQEQLYQHYQTFTHDRNMDLARADIQSVSDSLYWVSLGTSLDRFTQEHFHYFGVASTEDLKHLAGELTALKQAENAPPQP